MISSCGMGLYCSGCLPVCCSGMRCVMAAARHDPRPHRSGAGERAQHLSREEQIALDVEFADQCTLGWDIRSLAMPVRAVSAAEGVSAPSWPEFMGHPGGRAAEPDVEPAFSRGA